MLFSNNPEHTIPRTNNNMEQFFRKLRRNVRKRCGNIATGNILAQSGVSLAIFQNMDNPEYVKIVFGDKDIPSVFAFDLLYCSIEKFYGILPCNPG